MLKSSRQKLIHMKPELDFHIALAHRPKGYRKDDWPERPKKDKAAT